MGCSHNQQPTETTIGWRKTPLYVYCGFFIRTKQYNLWISGDVIGLL